MSEAHWKTCDDTILGLEADFEPECVFCSAKMEDLSSLVSNFATDSKHLDDYCGYAVDVLVVCPSCGWVEMFGVAIDKEHHKRLQVVRENILENLSVNA